MLDPSNIQTSLPPLKLDMANLGIAHPFHFWESLPKIGLVEHIPYIWGTKTVCSNQNAPLTESILRITFGDLKKNVNCHSFLMSPLNPPGLPRIHFFSHRRCWATRISPWRWTWERCIRKRSWRVAAVGRHNERPSLCPAGAWRLLGWGVWDLTWFNYIVYV